MSTLEELVQVKRNELELEQLKLFEQSKALFIAKLNDVLGEKIVTSMNLIIKSKFKCLQDDSLENVQAIFCIFPGKFLIKLETRHFNICRWNGTHDVTHGESWKWEDDVKSNLINYLANIRAFHNTEVN